MLLERALEGCSIEVLIIRVGFWGILDYSYNKERTKIVLGSIQAPT